MISEKTDSFITKKMLDCIGSNHSPGLRIGSILAEDLASKFGTPIYAYNAEAARNNLSEVRSALGSNIEILYALKANPNAGIAQIFRKSGTGCEVASAGEILVAKFAGFTGDQIQFSGPGKSEQDILTSFHHGVSILNLESEEEYDLVKFLSKLQNYKPRVSIRLNPATGLSGSRMHMGGGSKKFGVDSERVPELMEQIVSEGICDFSGLHVYPGTQCFDYKPWLENANALLKLASELESIAPIRSLNFGGGFGVSLFEGDPELDLISLGKGLREMIESARNRNRKYFVELGRYLIANAGVYLTKILYTKKSQEKIHIITDGGMHHHAVGVGLGSVIKRTYPIVSCNGLERNPTRKVAIGGPLCTPADEFASSIDFPETKNGELIGILGSGAYGLTFSNILFLSHPTPGEVLVDGDNAYWIRKPGKVEDVLVGQCVPGREGGYSDVE
ncbi:diaminopimelate decarboxylase [Leptospira perolatii]|uniref:Diaminopimelate decarboxylase n=1 Tax=Leptospira perolatii TaxID=2023191 RepID=A0A2M9ZQH0_9LEPT|nr:diaminopimelate decarboxylase [Leptospira perolatii]PJZ70480.1 diaminopimelate decarboxylase [Leptospira perolatii]PJZ74316.1 diaminopimelate decarboxylase [Leptospira perolatii]